MRVVWGAAIILTVVMLTTVYFFASDSSQVLIEDASLLTQENNVPAHETVPNDNTLSEVTVESSIDNDDEGSSRESVDIETFSFSEEKIAALRDSRINGDDRTPALNKTRVRDELPTAEALSDPELYQQFERRQQNRMFRAFVESSKTKVAELEKMIEQGKEQGISDEEIAFAEQKIAGIQAMAEELQQEHPEIMDDSYAPPEDWLLNSSQEDTDF